MYPNQRLKLYQQRHFSDKINITFSFLRENAAPFFKAQLFIAGPVALLTTLMYTLAFSALFSDLSATASPDYMLSYSYFLNTMVTVLLSMLLMVAISLVSFSYMKLYHLRAEGRPEVPEVWQVVKRKILPALGLYVVMAVMVIVGFFFFFIPGIYLAVVLSLAVPVLVNDDKPVFASVGRCFDLIKGKWWSTFGLIFIMAIIAYIISALISVPASMLIWGQMFLSLDDISQGASPHIAPWALGLTALFSYAGAMVSNSIIQTAIGFQYYNLVERKESRGLMEDIEKVGDEREARNPANEGEY